MEVLTNPRASERLKVLFVAGSDNLYGANSSLLDILKGLDPERFEPYAMSLRRGEFTEQTMRLGIPTFIVSYKLWLWVKIFSRRFLVNAWMNGRAVPRIIALIKKHNIDLVYTNSAGVIAGALAARMTGKKHLWHIREFVSSHSLPFRLIDRLSDRIIVNSMATQKHLPQKLWDKVLLVYNGFDPAAYQANGAERISARGRYGIREDETLLALVGSINERKGQKEMLEALPVILDKHPRVKLMFAGEGLDFSKNYEKALHRTVESRGLEKSVIFAGFQEDIAKVYQTADILVVPSRYEAFGRVVVEGMLWGIPVIAARVGGIPEIIEHGKSGILVDSREPQVLADAVSRLLEDRTQWARLSREGQELASQRFGMKPMMEKIQNILLETFAAANRSKAPRT